jgi:hypothetical protein
VVEEMLAVSGICVAYETMRQRGKKFGETFADQIRPVRARDIWRERAAKRDAVQISGNLSPLESITTLEAVVRVSPQRRRRR